MSVSSIASTGSSTTAAAGTAEKKSNFDTDTFMQLLLAELKNQDPLEPMNNSEMVAQMAQLNSLQQLTSISSNIEDIKKYMESILGVSS